MAEPNNPQRGLTNQSAADSQNENAALQFVLNRFAVELEKMLPAKVIAFDRKIGRVTVQPMIHWVDVNNADVQRPQISNVPVFTFGAGNYHINFPINPGDLGWIYACDRDITLFKQSLKDGPPNSGRMHTFSDAVFFPDVMRQYVIAAEDANSMVIQTTDATTRIAIKPGQITITAPTKLLVTTPLAEFSANVHIAGTLTVDTDTVNAGISVKGHGHISSAPGVRTQGGAIN